MTAATIETELSVVYIVRPVAVAAAIPESFHSGQRLPMAALTFRVAMRAVERKIGTQIVIELPGEPVHRVVTVAACVRVATLMRIILAMAVDAVFRCIAEHVRLVAAFAVRFRMLAEQRETRQVVIEEYIVLPGGFVVAVVANDALLTVMGVVLGMAVVAGGLESHLENGLDVAVLAFDRGMGTEQGIVGVLVMVEEHVWPL